MTRTREIEVWVRAKEEDLLNHPEFGFKVYPRDPLIQDNTFKARLVFDLPERKAEITESKLRDCFDSLRTFRNDDERRAVFEFMEFSKQKLFRSEG